MGLTDDPELYERLGTERALGTSNRYKPERGTVSATFDPKAPGYYGPSAVQCTVTGCTAPAAPGYPCPHHWHGGTQTVTGGPRPRGRAFNAVGWLVLAAVVVGGGVAVWSYAAAGDDPCAVSTEGDNAIATATGPGARAFCERFLEDHFDGERVAVRSVDGARHACTVQMVDGPLVTVTDTGMQIVASGWCRAYANQAAKQGG